MAKIQFVFFITWPLWLGLCVGGLAWMVGGTRAGIGWGLGVTIVCGLLWWLVMRNWGGPQ